MIISTVGASVLSVAWYYGINKARRDNYANFYKTYDAEADFQRMKAAGVFNCVKVKLRVVLFRLPMQQLPKWFDKYLDL